VGIIKLIENDTLSPLPGTYSIVKVFLFILEVDLFMGSERFVILFNQLSADLLAIYF